MLAEFLQKIVDLTHGARQTKITTIPGIDDQVLVDHTDGSHSAISIPPPRRAHSMASMESFIALITNKTIAMGSEVHATFSAAVAWLDSERRDTAKLMLPVSARFAAAKAMDGKPMTISDAIKYLRTKIDRPELLPMIESLRTVDFKRVSTGQSVTGHGTESLGRRVEAAIGGTSEIPKEIEFTVPALEVSDLRHIEVTLTFLVVLDPQKETIEFCARPDTIANAHYWARDRVVDTIRQRVEGQDIPVFAGV